MAFRCQNKSQVRKNLGIINSDGVSLYWLHFLKDSFDIVTIGYNPKVTSIDSIIDVIANIFG